jgi:2,4-dienoyl-CoA reductase (NADPH2)
MSQHPHLLSPGRIGTLALRNRILMCPMGDNQATEAGRVTEQQIAYFEARARGGAALLLVGSVGITAPDGLASPNQSAIADTSYSEGWSRLADRVHAYGAKLALQLVHNGKSAVMDIVAARPMLVPSLPKRPTADPLMGMLTPAEAEKMGTPAQVKGAKVIYRVMSRDDIARMAETTADAVELARDAGVDACELHAGHGYLLDTFLSPTTNRREDEYGGSVENRARFLTEVLAAIRRRVGREYPLWCRINGEELLTQGQTLEDACRVAELAEAAGADALHVSVYADPARGIGYTEAHATHVPGRFLPHAAAVKQRVGIPVIAVGRLEPDLAEQVLAEGKADFIAMGRKLLADPELPNKLAAGAPEDVRPCIYHYRCISQIFVSSSVRCAVNAFTGFEASRKLEPAARSRRVLVVGGGPAGLEAARLASLRGHRVTLADAAPQLGGRFRLAAQTTQPNAALLRWLVTQLEASNVEIKLDTQLSAEAIAAHDAEEILIATGARWELPGVPGAELPHVIGVDHGLAEWLSDEKPAAGECITVVGGNQAGLAIAEVARGRGAAVTVLEESAVFAAANGLVGRWRFVHDAREHGIELRGESRLSRIESGRVYWLDAQGTAYDAQADRVIATDGARADTSLLDAMLRLGVAATPIGDSRSVAFVEGAMQDATQAVLAL